MTDIEPEESLLRWLSLVGHGGALTLSHFAGGATRGAAPRYRVRTMSCRSVLVGATSTATRVEILRSPSRLALRSHIVIK